ncbi:MAG: uracil-DNA glycosylase [Xanthomonadaceae bacterium]|nr:uracil-DNA glycosylase [Xanthomonadaceae bacterium]
MNSSAEPRGFDPACRRCPRLSTFLDEVRGEHPQYHCAPVAPFGDDTPRVLVVGLAPGKHGANASGRPFTGDHAGILLFDTLHRHGFASAPKSVGNDDGLTLPGCRITNAVKCLPPQNKPTPAEVRACNAFLSAEIAATPSVRVIIALGRVAHDATLLALSLKRGAYPFAHGAEHRLEGGRVLVDSYHCSRYNTQTKRLTREMFDKVFARAKALAA